MTEFAGLTLQTLAEQVVASGSVGVVPGGGTSGVLPKFTGLNTIGDSIVTEDNGTIWIGGVESGFDSYAGQLNLTGPAFNAAGPHFTGYADGQDQPLYQLLGFSTDNIALSYDAFWDGAWKSSDVGSNFTIYKIQDKLKFRWDSGIAAGSVLTWSDAMTIDAVGQIDILTNLVVGTDPGGTGLLRVGGASNMGGKILIDTGDDMLALDHTSATGSPFMAFYQTGTRRSYIQHANFQTEFKLVNEYGPCTLWGGSGGIEVKVLEAFDDNVQTLKDLFVGVANDAAARTLHVRSNLDATIIIEADMDNATESDNPWLELRQDGNAVNAVLGLVGANDKAPDNTTYTGAVSNGILLGGQTTNEALCLGTNNVVRMTIATGGDITLADGVALIALEQTGNTAAITLKDVGGHLHDFVPWNQGTNQDGIALIARTNPASNFPIFVVASSGFAQRLRVEHGGALATDNAVFRLGDDESASSAVELRESSTGAKLDIALANTIRFTFEATKATAANNLQVNGQGYSSLHDYGDKSSNFTVNFDNANASEARVTGNPQISFSNHQNGGWYSLVVKADGTARTPTYTGVTWPDGTPGQISANQAILIVFHKVSTSLLGWSVSSEFGAPA